MTAKELYTYALDTATSIVKQVRADQLSLPTPDTEWTVRDLLQHITYELAWTADVVEGKSIAEVGDKYEGDLLGEDPLASWQKYKVRAREAVIHAKEADTAHLSYTDTTVADYLWEAGNDQLIHAWDLGEGIGVAVVFDEQVATELYDRALPRKDEFENSGLFAAAKSVPDMADTQTKLLALLGRSKNWRP